MIADRAPRPDVVSAGMRSRAAQRIVERYRRDGRVTVHTAPGWLTFFWAVSLLLAWCIVWFATTDGPADARGFGVGACCIFLLFFGWTAIRLVAPWNRVVVDREGLVVLGRRLPWRDIEWFATDAYVSRVSLPFVTVQVGEDSAATWGGSWWSGLMRQRTVHHPGEIALPYRLSPNAETLAAILQTLLTESRGDVTGAPGRTAPGRTAPR